MLRDVALTIVGKALETGRVPRYIQAGMMCHAFPKRESLSFCSMFQSVHCTLINILCSQNEIHLLGVESIPDSVVKSGRIYKHSFRVKSGKEFILTEVVRTTPDSSCGLLSRCILECKAKGCFACSFGANKQDDIQCEFCDDRLVPYLQTKGLANFADVGWNVFTESINIEHSLLMLNMSNFFQKFIKDDEYSERWQKNLDKIHESSLFGSYIGEDMEDILFSFKRK